MSAGLTAFIHWGFHRIWLGKKATGYMILGATLLAVGSVALWRSDQIAFLASVENETWHRFLVEYPLGTRVFVVALSVILPLTAGLVSSLVAPELLFASRWHWKKHRAESLRQTAERIGAQLAAFHNDCRLAMQDIDLEHEMDRREYLRHYHMGRNSRGADKKNEVAYE